MLEWSKRLLVLERLGEVLRGYTHGNMESGGFDFTERINRKILQVKSANNWFTEDFIKFCFQVWGETLTTENLQMWAARYPALPFRKSADKRKVAVIMAGNIPMVGMHDLISCILTGHSIIAKMSSNDALLLPLMGEVMVDACPELADLMFFTTDTIKGFDAVIATGSDNTSRYFDYYFGKYPHIIRKNRNSLAILTGVESFHELDDLCEDIFCYFGMGCRNVSKLYIPEDYDFENLTVLFDAWNEIMQHPKYRNNYDYHKSVMLLEGVPFIDHRNVMLRENKSLQSPLSVLHYERYTYLHEVENEISQMQDQIQCVVSHKRITDDAIPFGMTQRPKLWDYADGIDTVEFLLSL